VHYKLDRGVDHVLIDEAQDTSPRQWDISRISSRNSPPVLARATEWCARCSQSRRETVDLLFQALHAGIRCSPVELKKKFEDAKLKFESIR